MTIRAALTLAVVTACLVAPGRAVAADDRELRRVGTCSATSEIELRLRADNDDIRTRIDIDTATPAARWSLIVIRERRTIFRGTIAAGSGGTARFRRTVRNWFGPDTFVVRATRASGESCRVTGTI